MKKIILTILVLIVLIGIYSVYHIFFTTAPNTPTTQVTNPFGGNTTSSNVPTTSPTGGTTGITQTMPISLADGSSIQVADFTKDPETQTTPNIPGHYFISGGIGTANIPYSIFYVTSDQSFTISLLQEPIGQMRQEAEQELMQKLDIDEATMCQLRYTVLVSNDVNATYAGHNLGFSFCPGAVVLP